MLCKTSKRIRYQVTTKSRTGEPILLFKKLGYAYFFSLISSTIFSVIIFFSEEFPQVFIM